MKIMGKRRVSGLVAAAAAVLFAGCAERPEYTTVDGVMLGTTLHVVADVRNTTPQELYRAIMDLDREAKASMSIFDEGSLLSRLNRNETDSVDSFITRAEASRPTPETLGALQREYIAQTLDELFGFAPLSGAVEQMARTLSEHFFNKQHDLLTAYTEARQTLAAMAAVADKFGSQYRAILASGQPGGNKLLQERVRKAATYFAEQLKPLAALFAKTRVETGNKQVRKQLFWILRPKRNLLRFKMPSTL